VGGAEFARFPRERVEKLDGHEGKRESDGNADGNSAAAECCFC
jgi:hypothetical protein